MAQNQSGHYVVRTKLADALIAATHQRAEQGAPMNKPTRRLVRHVLTNEAKGIGIKFDSSRGSKKKAAAVSAVEVREAA